MNFFKHQDQARKNTRWLILLFLLAVVVLVLLTNTFVYLYPWQTNSDSFSNAGSNHSLSCLMQPGCDFWASINWQRAMWVSIIVISVIAGASLFKWLSILSGGKAVAEMMGGELLNPESKDASERRLLNVVEEMALAANMPVPAVYVLRGEMAINAFAAGFSSKDAVVAVTEGSLQRFNREQLQAVVAHEFSHILNGDMRLNMHLIAVLHGIMFITEIGFMLIRGGSRRHYHRSYSSSNNKNQAAAWALGLGLVVIGSIGTFFGNLIKAAVSRQREFLADASAVQFTRNNIGLADALKKIGGHSGKSLIDNSHGAEISHLFFGQALTFAQSFFATHPPLSERITRVQPAWDGEYLYPPREQRADKPSENEIEQEDHSDLAAMVSAIVLAGEAIDIPVGEPTSTLNTEQASVKSREQISEILHQSEGAAASVLALLLADDQTIRAKQLSYLQQHQKNIHAVIETRQYVTSNCENALKIIELSTTALRLLTADEYKQFKQSLIRLIKMDGQIDLNEWCLYQLITSSLDSHFTKIKPTKQIYKKPAELKDELQVIISLVVNATEQSDSDKQKAFDRACNTLGFYETQSVEFAAANMKNFVAACQKLKQAYPLLKARLLKAMADAAKMDGNIEPIEQSTLFAMAAILESPIPELDFE